MSEGKLEAGGSGKECVEAEMVSLLVALCCSLAALSDWYFVCVNCDHVLLCGFHFNYIQLAHYMH